MRIDILTLFPNSFSAFDESIIKRAKDKGLVDINLHNFREYSNCPHKKVDDYIFGGGAGMLLACQPIVDCIKKVDPNNSAYRIFLSPKGKLLNQQLVNEIVQIFKDKRHLLLLCGHYEGVDARVAQNYIDLEVSIGDYILSGGEIAAMVLVDTIVRNLDGVLGNAQSNKRESFAEHLLEESHYTRPENFEGHLVPPVLLSGNHKEIENWRHSQSIKITKERRPDLYKKHKKYGKK